MKKTKKTLAIAATFAMAMNLSGCVPPENNESQETTVQDTTESITIDETFRPEVEESVCVYGPPEAFEDETISSSTEFSSSTNNTRTTTSSTSDTVAASDVYDAEGQEEVCVYGPPADFDYEPSEETAVAVYGPPFSMPSSSDDSYCVYGPPEWFGEE